jgi:ABC-type branched-subunit amino acid transport system ATPase component
MQPVLSVEGLAVSYGPVAALQPVSFELAHGGLVLVLGPNGAGKTSLVRALAGAVRAQQGSIRLAGEDVTRIPAYKRVNCRPSTRPSWCSCCCWCC